ncbi:stage II sporulation protein D [Alteribacillus bidgolensis]|uniref:Stage II sporulation protein D n=1 Tax=Alteribacillus bidgolensis TaxID=930129 RepID=A0A1G8M3Z8_9BACI|nr:stage II sporulation protein D [Alteribacillus bidgolensis]SDI62668.1 stage II sporulation protein D [Alteribacillus bidgolensis]
MHKWIFVPLLFFGLFFLVPVLFVLLPGGEVENDAEISGDESSQTSVKLTKEEQESELATEMENVSIPVFRNETETVEEMELEEYVAGVVASEMPAEFEIEALKAQALTARTFIAREMISPSDINLPENALVTDTQMHQVYQNEEELREKWGDDYQWKMDRVKEAVLATKGQVLTYEGEPITAAFFSTSNGYTENAEDYWKNPVPYLQSVESPWDQGSPQYENAKRIAAAEVERLLGISIAANETGEIISRTDGGRVAELKLGGETFSGRDIREKLNLHSSDFQISREGEEFLFTTKGWGHGVGMSQYGADGMAKEGKDYKDILHHYYKGVDISSL